MQVYVPGPVRARGKAVVRARGERSQDSGLSEGAGRGGAALAGFLFPASHPLSPPGLPESPGAQAPFGRESRGIGALIPSAQRFVWAAKHPLGNAALGALFA